ncbi:MAG: hypothetical protein ACD_79C00311G0004 [uncultured bacterium]|nr:MAG: hypothetical protein ACD_79C00311G0004 [uncultured bacterium]
MLLPGTVENIMERALFIKNISDLSTYNLKKINVIYYGSEFCEKLIPSLDKITEVYDFCIKNNIKFAFITPYITSQSIDLLDSIFYKLSKILNKISPIEIIINDYGTLVLLRKYKELNKTFGRVLNKQKRDPRLEDTEFLVKWDIEDEGNLFNTFYLQKLKDENITRIEMDNVKINFFNNNDFKFNLSLYYPYVFLTTTRLCLFNRSFDVTNVEVIGECNLQCTKLPFFELENKIMHKNLILKGNSIFYTKKLSKNILMKKNIDRVVFEL